MTGPDQNDYVFAADALFCALYEMLLGQADTLEHLASLMDREQRPALLERARSHRTMASDIFDRAIRIQNGGSGNSAPG